MKRRRRSYQEIFLDKLAELSDNEPKLIGNGALRKELGWDQSSYDRIKGELKAANAIISGRGHGGTVALAKAPGTRALSAFISYAHADAEFKVELVKHLKPLETLGLIDQWHDGKIKPGDEINSTISEKLKSADILLLVISIDFLNSSYCIEVELEEALRRHKDGSAKIVPIIARSCLWKEMSFGQFLALPKDGKAASSWADRDEALTRAKTQ